MKKIYIIILFVTVVLSGCSSAKLVSEDQILENLKTVPFVVNNSEKVESFRIIRRTISEDKKKENIYAELVFDSKYAKVSAFFDINCNLGDDGWYILDSSMVIYEIDTLIGPSEAEVLNHVDNFVKKNLAKSGLNLGNKKLNETIISSAKNSGQVIVNVDFEDPYVREAGIFIIDASFELETGWTLKNVRYNIDRQWKLDERIFELEFTSIYYKDNSWKNYNDIYFSGTFIENYTDGSHTISNNLTLKFKNNNFGYTSVEKENDRYGTNQFILSYGTERYYTQLLQITYNYSKQEFEAYRFSGSSGYFGLKR